MSASTSSQPTTQSPTQSSDSDNSRELVALLKRLGLRLISFDSKKPDGRDAWTSEEVFEYFLQELDPDRTTCFQDLAALRSVEVYATQRDGDKRKTFHTSLRTRLVLPEKLAKPICSLYTRVASVMDNRGRINQQLVSDKENGGSTSIRQNVQAYQDFCETHGLNGFRVIEPRNEGPSEGQTSQLFISLGGSSDPKELRELKAEVLTNLMRALRTALQLSEQDLTLTVGPRSAHITFGEGVDMPTRSLCMYLVNRRYVIHDYDLHMLWANWSKPQEARKPHYRM